QGGWVNEGECPRCSTVLGLAHVLEASIALERIAHEDALVLVARGDEGARQDLLGCCGLVLRCDSHVQTPSRSVSSRLRPANAARSLSRLPIGRAEYWTRVWSFGNVRFARLVVRSSQANARPHGRHDRCRSIFRGR